MIEMTAVQQRVVGLADRAEDVRVEVEDADGAWRDVTSLLGRSRLLRFEIDSGAAEDAYATGSIVLWRREGKLNLSPFVAGSRFNVAADGGYGPLIDLNRAVRMSAYVGPLGYAASAYQVFFQGVVTAFDPAASQDTMRIGIADDGEVLQSKFIEVQRKYGSNTGSVSLESFTQSLLTDNGLAVTPFYPDASGWAVREFTQQNMPVMQALQAAHINRGWSFRSRYDPGTSSFRLTGWEPERERTEPHFTFEPSRLIAVQRCEVRKADIRNKVAGRYWDIEAGEFRDVFAIVDAASIAKYGEQFMLLYQDQNSGIGTLAEMQAFMAAALADSKDPIADRTAVTPFFPWAEIGDLYAFKADREISDSDQKVAVTRYRHTWEGGSGKTTFECRGAPSGAYHYYRRRDARDRQQEQVGARVVTALPRVQDDAFSVYVVGNAPQTASLWVSSLTGSTWSAPVQFATGGAGTHSGTGSATAGPFRYYAANASGELGPAFPLALTRHSAPLRERLDETAVLATVTLTPAPGAAYDFVEARTKSGNGAWSAWAQVAAGPPAAPAVTVALVEKHPSKIAYRVSRGGVWIYENVVTTDVGTSPDVDDLQIGYSGTGTAYLTAWFDTDTATGAGKAQYRVDGGSWTALTVTPERTATWTLVQSSTAVSIIEVRGLNGDGSPGEPVPCTMSRYTPELAFTETITRTATAATLTLTPVPGIVYDTLQARTQAGTDEWSAWYTLTGTPLQISVALVEKHPSSFEYRVYRGSTIFQQRAIPGVDTRQAANVLHLSVTENGNGTCTVHMRCDEDTRVGDAAWRLDGGAWTAVAVNSGRTATWTVSQITSGPRLLEVEVYTPAATPTLERDYVPRWVPNVMPPRLTATKTAESGTTITWTFDGVLGAGGTAGIQVRVEADDGTVAQDWIAAPLARTFNKPDAEGSSIFVRVRDGGGVEGEGKTITIPGKASGLVLALSSTSGSLRPGVRGAGDFGVGDTAVTSVARNVQPASGQNGVVVTFPRACETIPTVYAILRKGTPPSGRFEICATEVTKTTCKLRAVNLGTQTLTARTDYFSTTQNGTENPAGLTISADGAALYTSLDDANGIGTTFGVKYDVDASAMDPSNTLAVQVWRNDGPSSVSWTLVGQKLYWADPDPFLNETIVFDATLSAGWDLRLLLDYASSPGVALAQVTGKQVDFNSVTPGTETSLASASGDLIVAEVKEAP